MKSPRPWRCRPSSAAQIADVAWAAVERVDDRQRMAHRAAVDRPVSAIIPDSAWRIGSKPGPRRERALRTRRPRSTRRSAPGRRRRSCAGPRPRRSITPGRKFSITTSLRRRQPASQLLAGGLRQVDGDAALRAVEREERGAATVTAGRSRPDLVAGDRVLDLDHVGAEVGELLRAQRPGDDPREVEHADPLERRRAPHGGRQPNPRRRFQRDRAARGGLRTRPWRRIPWVS